MTPLSVHLLNATPKVERSAARFFAGMFYGFCGAAALWIAILCLWG